MTTHTTPAAAQPTCNGLCLTTADVGVAVAGNPVAYPHPACPQHGDPGPLTDDDGTCGDCMFGRCHGTDPEDCGCARHDASVADDRD